MDAGKPARVRGGKCCFRGAMVSPVAPASQIPLTSVDGKILGKVSWWYQFRGLYAVIETSVGSIPMLGTAEPTTTQVMTAVLYTGFPLELMDVNQVCISAAWKNTKDQPASKRQRTIHLKGVDFHQQVPRSQKLVGGERMMGQCLPPQKMRSKAGSHGSEATGVNCG